MTRARFISQETACPVCQMPTREIAPPRLYCCGGWWDIMVVPMTCPRCRQVYFAEGSAIQEREHYGQ